MGEDAEPSAKKKKGMGAGTLLSASPAREKPAAGEAASGSVPQDTPASEDALAREQEIKEVLACMDAGEDWTTAVKKRGVGRPKKPDVMPAGALEKCISPSSGSGASGAA
eukprot:4104019-Amphidinium_carterae.1